MGRGQRHRSCLPVRQRADPHLRVPVAFDELRTGPPATTNPQGIADPAGRPSGFSWRTKPGSSYRGSHPRSITSLSPRNLSPAAFTHDSGRQLGLGPRCWSLGAVSIPSPRRCPPPGWRSGCPSDFGQRKGFPTYLGLE